MITRSKMRRQLYSGGGITDLYPRQKYGIGSWVKERVRKLIPNELADVAVKAAPFVAPFNPAIAGIMRGVGRFDQRGSISDALKQGALTYGFGKGARYLGGATGPAGGPSSYNLSNSPISKTFQGFTGKTTTPVAEAARTVGTSGAPGGGDPSMFLKPGSDQGFFSKVLFGKEGGTGMFGDKGLIGAGGEFDLGQSFGKGVPAVFAGSTIAAYAAQKALGDVGERESGESLEAYNKRRKGTVGQYLDFYFRRANRFRIPPEDMDAAAAKFVEDNTKEYVSHGGRIGFSGGSGYLPMGMWAEIREAYKQYEEENKDSVGPLMSYKQFWNSYIDNLADGGRVGYQTGGITMANTLQENIRRNQAQAAANEGVLQAARSKLPGYVAPTTPEQKATVAATNLTNSMLPTEKQSLTMGPVSPVVGPGGPMPMGLMMPPSGNYNVGSFGPEGIVIDGKRYYSEKEAIEDMGIERYNMFMSKGGRVGYSDGSKFLTPRIGDLWKADLGGGPMENIVKMGMTVRAPLIDVIRIVYGTGKKATEIIGKAAELGFDLTKPAREAIGYVAKKGLEGTKFALGHSDKFRYGTKNYYALRAAGMSDDEARLFLQDNKIGEFRKDKNLIKKLESRLMDEKVGESPDQISMEEVELYPGRGEKTKRMGQMGGTGPNGLPGIPKQAPDGMEFDMRENGGFQPLGAKEKKDDVPAMLAKNEFVFTADAVRGAGGGDIELGAQRMYDTMKNLEKRVV